MGLTAAEPKVELATPKVVRPAAKKIRPAAARGLPQQDKQRLSGGYAALFAQVLERNLDAIIVELLIVRAELIAAIVPR